MEQAPVRGDLGWRWTLATTPDDAALFIPMAAIPTTMGQDRRVTVSVGSDRMVLDMDGAGVRLQPAHAVVAARLLAMGSIVIAEQGGERCWVANVYRMDESAKVMRA